MTTPTDQSNSTRRQPARTRRVVQTVCVMAFWLLVWQVLAWIVSSSVLLASPLEVVIAFGQLVPTVEFWAAIGFSTSRIVGGFLLALIVGTGLATLGARWPLVAAILSPPLRLLRAVPVVSFVLLVLIWANAETLSIIISFIMVMPIVYANVAEGLTASNLLLDELAMVFDLSARRRWWAITLPNLMPYLTAATNVGLGLCWKAGISAEVIGLTSGSIGDRLYQAKLFLSTGDLFCWTAVIVTLAWAVEKTGLAGISAVNRRLARAYAR